MEPVFRDVMILFSMDRGSVLNGRILGNAEAAMDFVSVPFIAYGPILHEYLQTYSF